jgi:hypothetical protein
MSKKKSKIKNGFDSGSKVKVEWCHPISTTCRSITVGNFDEPPAIGGSMGHLIVKALGPNGVDGMESKITLKPPYPEDHNILFSYDTSGTPPKYEWKIEAEEAEKIDATCKPNNTWQIDVNVEIGPKIPISEG